LYNSVNTALVEAGSLLQARLQHCNLKTLYNMTISAASYVASICWANKKMRM